MSPFPRQGGEAAVREISAAGLTVRLFEDMPAARRGNTGRTPWIALVEEFPCSFEEANAETLSALEEEIDFRRAPEFAQPLVLETQPIPGNLIEFPRELVAPRRARPRLAEGPLTEEPGEPQLRIFEVDAEILEERAPAGGQPHPEWQTLQLGGFESEQARGNAASDAQTHLSLPLYTAPLERRLMSAAVDLCASAVRGWRRGLRGGDCRGELRTMPLPLTAVSGLAAFAVFAVLYQVLFFAWRKARPGMRYARIALCTFGEGNPSRRAMRRRVLSTVLAAVPAGVGLAWMLLDNDRLGWHDRMSRMYQRAY